MNTRTLGQGLEVSALGLGCMGMSQSFPPIPPREERYSEANQRMIANRESGLC